MNGPRDYHTKLNKSNRDKYHIISVICGIWKKWYKLTYLQNGYRLTDFKNKLMVTKGEKWGENKLGVGDEKMHPLYINTQHYI